MGNVHFVNPWLENFQILQEKRFVTILCCFLDADGVFYWKKLSFLYRMDIWLFYTGSGLGWESLLFSFAFTLPVLDLESLLCLVTDLSFANWKLSHLSFSFMQRTILPYIILITEKGQPSLYNYLKLSNFALSYTLGLILPLPRWKVSFFPGPLMSLQLLSNWKHSRKG